MGFGVGSLRGTGDASGSGHVDYRLARQHVVNEFRRGRLSRRDVCDAHPELLRVARNVGGPDAGPCPICEEPGLVLVTFVFGDGLPASGRCVTSAKEMARFSRRGQDSTCYVVEVCTGCTWNHLRRSFPLGRRLLLRAR